MSVVLGFGSTERDFIENERREIKRFALTLMRHDYFRDDDAAEIKDWLNDRAKELRDDAEKWSDSDDHPDRYSYYWPRIVYSASDIIVILRVHHINRRHALSPDGWGLMAEDVLIHIEHDPQTGDEG